MKMSRKGLLRLNKFTPQFKLNTARGIQLLYAIIIYYNSYPVKNYGS